ncbi:hypothetical protein CCB80_08735 [Armatimonadetes bacterium Uphvl-Ar1]|nr:hypothetical protein CCB80_08735 [Armatimonadetes bacterium Uphvl-Ar1]
MSLDRKTKLAVELYKLGVSKDGVIELLAHFSEDEIERQLIYLPYRRAKRKEAFIVDAIKKSYSPPKEYYYAQTKADLAAAFDAVDQGSQRALRQGDSESQGHGTPDSPDPDPANLGLAAREPDDHADLPNFDGTIR